MGTAQPNVDIGLRTAVQEGQECFISATFQVTLCRTSPYILTEMGTNRADEVALTLPDQLAQTTKH